jgi:hypothetical protein
MSNQEYYEIGRDVIVFGEKVIMRLNQTEHSHNLTQEERLNLSQELGNGFSDIIDILAKYGFWKEKENKLLLAFSYSQIYHKDEDNIPSDLFWDTEP